MAESSASMRQPIGGRRHKGKSPPVQPQPPDLPSLPQGGDSSDEIEEDKDGLERFEYDRLMGVPLVGSTSEEIGDGEGTEVVEIREEF